METDYFARVSGIKQHFALVVAPLFGIVSDDRYQDVVACNDHIVLNYVALDEVLSSKHGTFLMGVSKICPRM